MTVPNLFLIPSRKSKAYEISFQINEESQIESRFQRLFQSAVTHRKRIEWFKLEIILSYDLLTCYTPLTFLMSTTALHMFWSFYFSLSILTFCWLFPNHWFYSYWNSLEIDLSTDRKEWEERRKIDVIRKFIFMNESAFTPPSESKRSI